MKKETSLYFQSMVDHIFITWKKKKGFGYPFRGRDFRELKMMTRNFKEWQIMALWDVFILNSSEWVEESGHSITSFLACLPWLVDDSEWKERSARFEIKICGETGKEVSEVINDVMANKKNYTNEVKREELRREGLT